MCSRGHRVARAFWSGATRIRRSARPLAPREIDLSAFDLSRIAFRRRFTVASVVPKSLFTDLHRGRRWRALRCCLFDAGTRI